jgi:hypothetical protein
MGIPVIIFTAGMLRILCAVVFWETLMSKKILNLAD